MTTPYRRPRRPIVALIAASLLAAIGPTTVSAAAPTAERGFVLDFGARRDFVAQTNFVQCVGASMQMMINMAAPGRDRSAATQRRLQELARSTSGPRPDGSIRQGASVIGWSTGLNRLGVGPYRVVGAKTLQGALKIAARAMRRTGRPVGLLVWQGRHAWVMSGFEATADPLTAKSFRVTHAIVEDPLYPHGSSIWGPSPAPGAALTPKQVGRQFVPKQSSTRWAAVSPWSKALSGLYVLVLPYPEPHPSIRRLL